MCCPDLAELFNHIFLRLLVREDVADHEEELSGLLEAIAANLLGDTQKYEGCYFDGAARITAVIHPPRTIEIQGDMWIGRDRD